MQMEPGRHYLMFIPPSWIIAGTVTKVDGDLVELHTCVWNETCNAPFGVFDMCETLKASERSWPMPDGTVVLRSSVLICAPAQQGFEQLVRKHRAEVLKKTWGDVK